MKRTILYLLLVGVLVSLCSCNTKKNEFSLRITPTGVLVSNLPSDMTNIYLQVVNQDIVWVMKAPKRKIFLYPGMMCSWHKTIGIREMAIFYPQRNPNDEFVWNVDRWNVYWKSDTLTLRTPTMKVLMYAPTGELSYYDKNDCLLLKEQDGGGVSFSPITVDEEDGYTIRQIFESPEDEAFYGLGQHQSDEFNYKGKNEILYQYNTKVSVPFVVSNKNYGLLWDCYSLTKWGDVRDYGDLDQFILCDKYGQEGSLTATYSRKNNPNRVLLERQEKTIDYQNLNTIHNLPEGLNLSKVYVQWDGTIEPKESGEYQFALYYAGYVSVLIDDMPVVPERWRTAWNPNTYKFTLNMTAGVRQKICIKWLPDGGTSYLGLKALSPLPDDEKGKISLWSEMAKEVNYYFVRGDNADKVISGYRYLTGKAQVMPKWAMGFWQSRERYKTQNEVVNTLAEFRSRNIPIDNIVLDWSYWPEEEWGSHEFDATRFPSPDTMVNDVHRMNAHIMISVWPKFYKNTAHYKELDDIGGMYHQAVKDDVHDWIGPGYVGSFYDAFSPKARELYWQQINEHIYSKGFDAWWMDASEPDILSNADMAYRKKLMNPTFIGSSTEYFNAYGLVNAQAIYEGQKKVDPYKRVFILTRSGYAGSQRYGAAIWSGDIGTRWEDMKAQITAGQNYSISGNPYWTMDNGGFCVEQRYQKAKEGSPDKEEWRELNLRWHQFGAFVPLFRTHGQYPYRELWNIAPEGHPAYSGMLYYTQLRYRLMPYIYTLAGKCYHEDYTIMRPLMMDYGKDTTVLNVSDQYMFGPSLMVCPVYQYQARQRSVYFPESTGWYDVYTGRYYAGGQRIEVPAPYQRMPVFAAAGSIVPTGKVIQHTKEPQVDLTLYVYAGKDGSFSLYEDEGNNDDYVLGKYTMVTFRYHELSKKLTISELHHQYGGMYESRRINVVYVTPSKPGGFDQSTKTCSVLYVGGNMEINL